MKRILATTAIVALTASPVLAQSESTDKETTDQTQIEGTADSNATATEESATGTADTGSTDMDAADSGSADTGSADTGSADMGTTDTGTADTDTSDSAMDTTETDMTEGSMDASELTADDRAALTAEDLEGLAVHGPTGESLGEISDLVVSDDGEITKVVIDVGGFLGIGEKPVAVEFSEVTFSRGETEDALHASTSLSEEELENMEAWEAS
ncbi:MAG: PRC-barrel domain-containing protein [Roseovarius sp.]